MPFMKTPRRSYLTQHRRQRLVLWALAMLMWIASLPPANSLMRGTCPGVIAACHSTTSS